MDAASCLSKCRTAPSRPSLTAWMMPSPQGQLRQLAGAENKAFRSFFCIRLRKKVIQLRFPVGMRTAPSIFILQDDLNILNKFIQTDTLKQDCDIRSQSTGSAFCSCWGALSAFLAACSCKPTSRSRQASSFCNRSAASSWPSCLVSCAGVRPQTSVNVLVRGPTSLSLGP